MAHTHIQPAEPSTLGYRFAVYAQDLLEDWHRLSLMLANLRGKGLKGAVGTQASFQEILKGTNMTPELMEQRALGFLNLPYYPISTQTYSRQQDLHILQVLAGIASSMHKFAYDFRILQSPMFGEWSEPFGKSQVGSSAMPHKRNPINSENICSLARYVASLPGIAWDNASQAILERSLDDSANRRMMLPEGFLATDEILKRGFQIISQMKINEGAINKNLSQFGPFAATERVLMQMVANGADRQQAHEWLSRVSSKAWQYLQTSGENPLAKLMIEDEDIRRFVTEDQITEDLNVSAHTGTAADRAIKFAENIRVVLALDS
jgi:adenylosuccinate lyase